MTLILLVAVGALVVGALLYIFFHGRIETRVGLDRIVFFVLPVLVGWDAISDILTEGDWLPFLAILVGFGVLHLIERVFLSLGERLDDAAIFLGMASLALHALVEGGALIPGASQSYVVAVVLHRIPVGLLVFWFLQPKYGNWVPFGVLTALITATCVGFAIGLEVFSNPEAYTYLHVFNAFAGGTLLHCAYHIGRHRHQH